MIYWKKTNGLLGSAIERLESYGSRTITIFFLTGLCLALQGCKDKEQEEKYKPSCVNSCGKPCALSFTDSDQGSGGLWTENLITKSKAIFFKDQKDNEVEVNIAVEMDEKGMTRPLERTSR